MIYIKRNLSILNFIIFAVTVLLPTNALAQESQVDDTEKLNQFTIDAELMTRGEIRRGGLPSDENDNDNKANFIIERTRLSLDYERSFLKAHITGQHSAVWGQAGKGSFNIYEAWAQLNARNGLFAKIGRQVLSYDDERIIGSNDWAVAALSHDLLKVGYENKQHKVHAMFAYNQNGESVNGGTAYRNGDKPYKTMQALWYHYDLPKAPFGASLLFMNLGMQGIDSSDDNKTYQQQLIGTYLSYKPSRWTAEGSFYYQMGKNENGIKLDAWMASIKGTFKPIDNFKLIGGYDYLSGDEYFAVPQGGNIGLTQHKVIKGFSPAYGSHHKFYGAMDFFYMTTYVNGFSPGLQNLFFGADYLPINKVKINATYHYFLTATKLKDVSKSLGHEIELSVSYTPIKEISIAAGYSFMHGTQTMEYLKRVDNTGDLHWAWINVVIKPRFLQVKW